MADVTLKQGIEALITEEVLASDRSSIQPTMLAARTHTISLPKAEVSPCRKRGHAMGGPTRNIEAWIPRLLGPV